MNTLIDSPKRRMKAQKDYLILKSEIMKKEFWVDLPVKNLGKSKDFFMNIGFRIKYVPGNPDNRVCLLAGKYEVVINIFEDNELKKFSGNEIAVISKATEVLFNIGAENRQEVDEFAHKVKQAGGEIYRAPEEKDGWMYGCGFQDLDGHRWSMLYMDMSKMPQ